MEKCEVCGVELICEKGVCSSCTEFFKWKYRESFEENLKIFLETIGKPKLNFRRKRWKKRH
ncbi:hypothetical protein KAI32_02595 [Candidatus Pacearchaeota archaeon]|nr:hypothetical protein [Candidatus Pacearchaeota archaeon]